MPGEVQDEADGEGERDRAAGERPLQARDAGDAGRGAPTRARGRGRGRQPRDAPVPIAHAASRVSSPATRSTPALAG